MSSRVFNILTPSFSTMIIIHLTYFLFSFITFLPFDEPSQNLNSTPSLSLPSSLSLGVPRSIDLSFLNSFTHAPFLHLHSPAAFFHQPVPVCLYLSPVLHLCLSAFVCLFFYSISIFRLPSSISFSLSHLLFSITPSSHSSLLTSSCSEHNPIIFAPILNLIHLFSLI